MASNLVGIPFKLPLPPPPALSSSIVEFINATSSTVHPSVVQPDARTLENARSNVYPASPSEQFNLDVGAVDRFTLYYAHLSRACMKLPSDIGCSFSYAPLFSSPTAQPAAPGAFAADSTPAPVGSSARSSLVYERNVALYNLAALYAHIGTTGARRDEEGLKTCLAALQNAAGILDHLLISLPDSTDSDDDTDMTSDLTRASVSAMRDLCLAQGQEIAWQKAVLGRMKNTTISKLAVAVSQLYAACHTHVQAVNEDSAVGQSLGWRFPDALVAFVQIKRWHFEAVAQYRRSMDDLGANRYGDELTRLSLAEEAIKKALTVGSGPGRRGVPEGVMKDLKGLQSTVADNKARATKDNSLIYLEAPTPITSLPALAPAILARATIPTPVRAPQSTLFAQLIPREAHTALALYADRRSDLIRSSLVERCASLDREQAQVLSSLGLPAAVEAATSLAGERGTVAALPPSMREKAREVKTEGGAERLRKMMKDVRTVARAATRLVDETGALLSQEAEEDEALRGRYGTERWTRPPSSAAAAQLYSQLENFAGIVSQASKSDALVRTKFGQWESKIELLGGDEDALERSIPRIGGSGNQRSASQSQSLRTLRRLLDDLTDARTARSALVADGKYAAQQDEHGAKAAITNEAERLVSRAESEASEEGGPGKVSMALFEDVIDKQLRKFETFVKDMQRNADRQEDLLDQVKTAHASFIKSRQTDPALAEREQALKDLDAAFHMHREILTNLQEGLKFYGDLSRMLTELRDGVKQWTQSRSHEAKELNQTLLASRLNDVRLSGGRDTGGEWTPDQGIRFG